MLQSIVPGLIIYQIFLRKRRKGGDGDGEEEGDASNQLHSFFGDISKSLGVDSVLETVQESVEKIGGDVKSSVSAVVGNDASHVFGEVAEVIENVSVMVGGKVFDFAKNTGKEKECGYRDCGETQC